MLPLALLGAIFIAVVALITFYHHTLLLPVFVGMFASFKGLLKFLTPKFLVLFFKNSIFLRIKQILIKSSTRFVVLSHRPWRHLIRNIKDKISRTVLEIIAAYMSAPLWLRTVIALGVLFTTASSSYVVLALLIIPQPILAWLRKLLLNTLNKLGITKLLNAVWKYLVPEQVQYDWYMYRKWTLGRRQIVTAKQMHNRIKTTAVNALLSKNNDNKT